MSIKAFTGVSLSGLALVCGGGMASVRAAEVTASDVAAAIGIRYPAGPSSKTQGESAVWRQDGRLHIMLSAHNGGAWPHLVEGEGGSFQAVASPLKKADWHGCFPADFGAPGSQGPDGRPDLYCTKGADQGKPGVLSPKALFLQRSDGTFANEATAWGVADPTARGRDAVVLDWNRDDLADLATFGATNAQGDSLNRLYRNIGGRMEEVIDPTVTRADGGAAAATGDIDGDGFVDMAAVGGQSLRLYRNNAGSGFEDATALAGSAALVGSASDVELADLSGDGRVELVTVTQRQLAIRSNIGGAFTRISFKLTITGGRDVAVGDLDGDGDRDLFVVLGTKPGQKSFALLNRGDGIGWNRVEVPNPEVGNGDVATAIPDWRGTGRAAVLVTNGRYNMTIGGGPVQLIEFTPVGVATAG